MNSIERVEQGVKNMNSRTGKQRNNSGITAEQRLKTMKTVLKFDKNRTRVKACPCGKSNKDGKFSVYQGYEDKGYCHSCGNSFLPNNPVRVLAPLKRLEVKKEIDIIPLKYLEEAYYRFKENDFYTFYEITFGKDAAEKVFKLYLVGTSDHVYRSATLFPQIDVHCNFRQCKIISYFSGTGKRWKFKPDSHVGFVQKRNQYTGEFETVVAEENTSKEYGRFLGKDTIDLNLKSCFFGEHLLTEYPDKIVCVVESAKTAMIAANLVPERIWLSTEGATGLKKYNYEFSKVLAGRRIILYPDLKMFDDWKDQAEKAINLFSCEITISNIIEKVASEDQRKSGYDLADFLINEKQFKL